jgi:hypothetical protein
MEREFLERQLAEGRSLEYIGARVGKDPTTVAYWLKKHGLVAAHHDKYAPKGGVDRDRLTALIADGKSQAEIAADLSLSLSTVNYWLRKYGLKTMRALGLTKAQRARAAGVRVLRLECATHGLVDFQLTSRGTYRCLQCRSDAVTRRRRRVKEILVQDAGGSCVRCGFAEHPAALHFHHIDPATKAFSLSTGGISRSLAKARAEARKCVLLCSNCHALVEAGVASV